ncbi:hypothetical protein EVAR_57406_1 [Eumeta japonica]|uniref:Uncharacterized protein n=1 Tax=Eumeta variegata TaxID=151549 RepID=A0A4C1YB19_EUMVA|nr:hypothetical protein EVAR_57406_1 [Eumeta japonica]
MFVICFCTITLIVNIGDFFTGRFRYGTTFTFPQCNGPRGSFAFHPKTHKLQKIICRRTARHLYCPPSELWRPQTYHLGNFTVNGSLKLVTECGAMSDAPYFTCMRQLK